MTYAEMVATTRKEQATASSVFPIRTKASSLRGTPLFCGRGIHLKFQSYGVGGFIDHSMVVRSNPDEKESFNREVSSGFFDFVLRYRQVVLPFKWKIRLRGE